MNKPSNKNPLDLDIVKIIEAKHHDPFSVLGRHTKDGKTFIRVFLPYAETVCIESGKNEMQRIPDSDVFEYYLQDQEIPQHYSLLWEDKAGNQHQQVDPYSFGPVLPEFDQHLFGSGRHWHIYQKLGAHLQSIDGIDGVYFAVWAPNAQRVSVVGDFKRSRFLCRFGRGDQDWLYS